uniref:C2H2-type domain-containing protein n=1 Tax=Plectus sambesii TaxID=2011161 RepID=A0A914WU60_9BILA
MVTEDVDDMSLWIRQCSIDRRQKISSKVENETLELNPVLNSTADEECPDEEAFAVNYQHSFLNETNFESFGGLEKSAMNVSETSAVGNIESPDDMAPNVNSNFCPPSMAVLFSHPNEPPQLECFGCNSNGSGGVGNLSSNTVFGSINTIAFDHRYTEQEIMEKEKTIVDDDGYPEYVTAGSTAIAANATQRIERLIAFNTDYISTAAKKATCRVCGQTDPNKHKHALRHMNVPDMFACSFCNMVHAWNRQVIIEHGKRKHKSNQALVSQEDKYSAGIAAAKMRCFPTPAQLAESLNSPNLTATTTHQPTFTTSFSSCNDVTLQNQSLVGSSATAKDVADWNSAGLPWSPNCYICGQVR